MYQYLSYNKIKQPLKWMQLVRNSPGKFWQFVLHFFIYATRSEKKCVDLFDRVEGELREEIHVP